MIITVSSTPGGGASTAAKTIAKKLGLKYYSAGDFMRRIADKKGLSLQTANKLAEKTEEIDREIDEETKKLAKKDNFVIDSVLAFHFIPKSIKIFLKIDDNEAAERILNDVMKGKRKEESEIKTKKDALKSIRNRIESEDKRYKKYYGVDFLDEKNYDFVLDTTGNTVKETGDEVMDFIKDKL